MKPLLAGIISLLTLGCTDTHGPGERTISFDVNNVTAVKDAGIVSDADIISLQTPDVCIGNIDKIEVRDTLMYLMDMDNDCLYIFTTDGRYVNTISRKGHGANEYVRLDDFFTDGDEVCLLSGQNMKLYRLDALGKEVTSTVALPKRFRRMEKWPGGYIGYMANYTEDPEMPFNYWLMDKDFRLTAHFGTIDPRVESLFSLSLYPISVGRETVYFTTNECMDAVHVNLTTQEELPLVHFDFGEAGLAKDFQFPKDDLEWIIWCNKYVTSIYHVRETPRYLLAHFLYQGLYMLGLYDKETGGSKVLGLDAYTDKHLLSFGNIVGMTDNAIYTILDAQDMYNVWKGSNEENNLAEKYPEQVKNMREKFADIDPDGNPFLAIYHFK